MPAITSNRIAVLGSTGSIGTATLDVVEQLAGDYEVTALAANSQIAKLETQISRFSPNAAVASCAKSAHRSGWPKQLGRTSCKVGPDELAKLASSSDVDTVVAAIVGSAGLLSALSAVESGKRLALANKEALVVAGQLVMETASKNSAEIIPVDSEHSAIFQALQTRSQQPTIGDSQPMEVERLILTASGGSLRHWPKEKLANASVEDALDHPTWQMGRKITIDSATMMNKALEVIEARWLFNIPADRISVVIHPQSVIHSMVEFVDGSVLAQLSPPDMRLPIQYALTYPKRVAGPSPRIDWSQTMQLDWRPVDLERYPALELGFEVARRGGTAGAVLNAANEVAVELFLDKKIGFAEISEACKAILNNHTFDNNPTFEQLMQSDQWARNEVYHWAEIPR